MLCIRSHEVQGSTRNSKMKVLQHANTLVHHHHSLLLYQACTKSKAALWDYNRPWAVLAFLQRLCFRFLPADPVNFSEYLLLLVNTAYSSAPSEPLMTCNRFQYQNSQYY